MDATQETTTFRTRPPDEPEPGTPAAITPPALEPANGLADLIGGRVLAWVGGLAVAIGLILLVVLASAGHTLGVPERLALAGAGSLVLMGLGIWMHERRLRTEASIAAVGAATVGMFVVLAASARTGTIPGPAAVAGSLLVGGAAVALAIRWAGQAIGWLGLLGAVVAPLAVGGSPDVTTLGLLLIALLCLLGTAVWRRWSWLALAGLVCAIPGWALWSLDGHPTGGRLVVLGLFGAAGLAAACAERRRHADTAVSLPAVALVAVNALVVGTLGRLLLSEVPGDLWLAGFGAAHLVLGSLRRARLGVELRALLLSSGFVLVDVAFGLAFHGPVLAVGWAAGAVGFAFLRRRAARDSAEPSVIDLGLGAHIALVLIRVVVSVGDGGGASIAATVALAVACLTASVLVGPGRETVSHLLNGLGLAAIAWLTGQTLHGPVLVAAWTGEAVAVAQYARRFATDETLTRVLHVESAIFLAMALGHVLLVEAPPIDLIDGSPALGAAALALTALAAGAIRAGRAARRADVWRPWLITGGAVMVLYLLSVAIITLFQPAVGAVVQFGGALVEFSIRQQGQVVLSIVWGLIGLGGVFVGLRRGQDLVRNVALGLLVIAIAKVFAYDLSTLTSLYRVASLLGFGVLLLISGFTYQRLRHAAPRRR